MGTEAGQSKGPLVEHVGSKAAERIEADAESAGRKLIETTVKVFTDRGFDKDRVEIAVKSGLRKAAAQ